MAFDDDQEEVIEFVDTAFFYFFSFIIFYLCFKHSIHYFAFLEASKTETRSVKFIANQFFCRLFSYILFNAKILYVII
jgi:hypothetical protein